MSRYINQAGELAALGRGEGLKVVISNVSTGAVIHSGALANEEQTEAEYMAMHGFEPLEVEVVSSIQCRMPPDTTTTSSGYTTTVQLNVDGRISGTDVTKHWSVELAEAMEELTLATDDHNKATGRLARAQAAFERAKSNAENSILGN